MPSAERRRLALPRIPLPYRSPHASLHAGKQYIPAARPYATIVYRGKEGYITPCRRNVRHEPLHPPEDVEQFLIRHPVQDNLRLSHHLSLSIINLCAGGKEISLENVG